jgi:DNA-binding transcriptional ArsR family regulator
MVVTTMKPITTIDDPRYVKAMSHPLRVRILAILQERRASPNELAQVLEATLGTVAYHVRTLHQLGLIELVDETPVRGAVEHHYRAKVRPNVTKEAWASASPVAKQAAVGSSLQMIDEYARASAAAGGFDRAEAALIRLGMRLDEKGWQQMVKLHERYLADAEKIEAAANERLGKHGEGIDVGAVLMLFEAVRLSADISSSPSRTRQRRRTGARRTPSAT